MLYAGCFFLMAGVLWLVLKLSVSFDTECGAIGMVPVLDGAIGPPLFGWLGLGLINQVQGWPGFPWWGYPIGWLLSVIASGWALGWAGQRGKQYHLKQAQNLSEHKQDNG